MAILRSLDWVFSSIISLTVSKRDDRETFSRVSSSIYPDRDSVKVRTTITENYNHSTPHRVGWGGVGEATLGPTGVAVVVASGKIKF